MVRSDRERQPLWAVKNPEGEISISPLPFQKPHDTAVVKALMARPAHLFHNNRQKITDGCRKDRLVCFKMAEMCDSEHASMLV